MNTTPTLSALILTCLLAVAPALAQPPALPADADHAADALAQSPRHGEWANVTVAEGQPPVHTWVVYPERADKAPVVIVIHEIFGLTDWARAVADQLAAEGFIAVAPDLLSGKGPDGGGTESFSGDDVRNAVMQLPDDEVTQRLNAVRDYAIALPAATDKSATVGFCWGGSTSFHYATQQPALNAAIVYYGTAPVDNNLLTKIACPVMGLYGQDDARVNATLNGTTAAMQQLGKSYTRHIYDGAGHGFLRQQTGREGANQRASEQAWAETLTFLKTNLQEQAETSEGSNLKPYEQLVAKYFPFTIDVMRLTHKVLVENGQVNPSETDVAAFTNDLNHPASLNGLVEEFGRPDKKEEVLTANGNRLLRWWWGPVFCNAKDPESPVSAHGCSLE